MSSGEFITIKYFAGLRERVGTAEESLALTSGLSLAQLKQQLMDRNATWHDAFEQTAGLRASVNQEVSSMERVLESGDEVAFFPPVTGG